MKSFESNGNQQKSLKTYPNQDKFGESLEIIRRREQVKASHRKLEEITKELKRNHKKSLGIVRRREEINAKQWKS